MRKEFEMTQEDLAKLMESFKPVPAIALQCGTPLSVQENANHAWIELGDRMGFDGMTVEPSRRGNLFFTAEEKAPVESVQDSFQAAARPLIKWLCENVHPHHTIIVTPTGAELLEGSASTGDVFDYIRD